MVMCRKLNSLLMLALLVSVAGSASAELVGHWTFDNVVGTTVPDLAGGDDIGTLVNEATISASTAPVPSGTTHAADLGASWVGGLDDKDAVEVVETGNLSPGTGDWSLALWFNTRTIDVVPGGLNKQGMYGDTGGGKNVFVAALRTNTVEEGTRLETFFRDGANNNVHSYKTGLGIEANVWYHYAVTRSGGEINVYLNGALVDTVSGTVGNVATTGGPLPSIAGSNQSRSFNGLIDDVRVYNHALTEAEINDLVTPVGGSQARDPNPPHGATGVPNKVALTWTPGDYAPATNGHRVYFSQDFDDVNDGLPAALKGIQSAARYPEVGTLDLDWGEKCYWRIDEANDTTGWDEGQVWWFTVRESVLVDDMESYGDGDVVGEPGSRIWYTWKDGEGWTSPAPTYSGNGTGAVIDLVVSDPVHGGNQSLWYSYDNDGTNVLGTSGKAFYSEITAELADLGVEQDWNAAGVKSLSLWFRGNRLPSDPGTLTVGSPDGTYTMTALTGDVGGNSDWFHFAHKEAALDADVLIARIDSIDSTNGWAKAGVMMRDTLAGDSKYALIAITPTNGVVFRWRTDAGAGSGNVAEGGIAAPYWVKLERTAFDYFVAEYSPDGSSWTRLGDPQLITMDSPYQMGLAVAGNDSATLCQAEFSNVSLDDAALTGLTSREVAITNDAEPLYVALEDTDADEAIVTHTDPNAVGAESWQRWAIDLNDFAGGAFDLTKVKKITIGIGDRGATEAGGAGIVYFDDIELYPRTCIPELRKPEGDLNNDCKVDCLDVQIMAGDWLLGDYATTGLVGHWTFDNVVGTTVPDLAGGDDTGTLVNLATISASTAPVPSGTTHAADLGASWVGGLDDKDAVTVVETGNLSPGEGDWSLALWLFTRTIDPVPGGLNKQGFYGDTGLGKNVVVAALRTDTVEEGTKLNAFMRDGGNNNLNSDVKGLGIEANVWYHFAVSRSGGEMNVYFDGALVDTVSGTLGNVDTTGGPLPSIAGSAASRSFNGLIDDVRVYKRLLTAADVTALYSGGDVGGVYVPLTSPANLSDDEPEGSKKINFKDFSILAEDWLVEELWP